ncbi:MULTISPECIES: hypothetical protein [unclassified Bradyrhizobium]|uniref:hypothetical protein n=1 Tax=unclassified Bradyrhizobium TaxID=2631580 RepID=UPI00291703D2|nr:MULTISPECIES: hypothetical protein [unclassified Bradyrhizobium]
MPLRDHRYLPLSENAVSLNHRLAALPQILTHPQQFELPSKGGGESFWTGGLQVTELWAFRVNCRVARRVEENTFAQ